MGGRVAGQQRGGLLVRARLPQAAQQPGHAARVVEGGVGGGVAGQQRGGLLVRARLPQAVQQNGHAVRVVEGGVGGGPVRGAGVARAGSAEAGRGSAAARRSPGGGVLVQLGGGPVQAAGGGGVPERGLVAGRGVHGGGGPEACRGDLADAVRPAVLVQVVREPVQRPSRDAGRPPASCSPLPWSRARPRGIRRGGAGCGSAARGRPCTGTAA